MLRFTKMTSGRPKTIFGVMLRRTGKPREIFVMYCGVRNTLFGAN